MAIMSYVSVIERYHEHGAAIRELLASMLTGIAEPSMLTNHNAQCEALAALAKHYPFVHLLYTLDAQGKQNSDNVRVQGRRVFAETGRGRDRSQRPYFLLAQKNESVVVTEPYLSNAGGHLCVTAALRLLEQESGKINYLALDIDLAKTVAFLMGDMSRRRFLPLFKTIYCLIVVGLFTVVGVLLYAAFYDVLSLFRFDHTPAQLQLQPFSVIVVLTLALAIFDLGKTVLEEEVLMHKDIFRHSSTRRTITRFIAAILIAVSIEALLLMFKAALGDGEHILNAVWMMFAAVGLLIALGVYVNLGAKAEVALLNQKKN